MAKCQNTQHKEGNIWKVQGKSTRSHVWWGQGLGTWLCERSPRKIWVWLDFRRTQSPWLRGRAFQDLPESKFYGNCERTIPLCSTLSRPRIFYFLLFMKSRNVHRSWEEIHKDEQMLRKVNLYELFPHKNFQKVHKRGDKVFWTKPSCFQKEHLLKSLTVNL